MILKFWQEDFDTINKSSLDKKIIKCKVCGDILFFNDSENYIDFGWKKFENLDLYACHNCVEIGYLSEKEAKELDEEILNKYGSLFYDFSYNEDYNKKYLIREKFTWDEHLEEIKEYKENLKFYLENNNVELLQKYKNDILD